MTEANEDTKPCPVCGETIKAVALKCRFCNTDLPAYAQMQTFEGESDLFTGRPALIYSIGQTVPFLVLIAIAVGLPFLGVRIDWTLLGFAVLFLALVVRLYIQRGSRKYQITNQRIKVE